MSIRECNVQTCLHHPRGPKIYGLNLIHLSSTTVDTEGDCRPTHRVLLHSCQVTTVALVSIAIYAYHFLFKIEELPFNFSDAKCQCFFWFWSGLFSVTLTLKLRFSLIILSFTSQLMENHILNTSQNVIIAVILYFLQ